MPTMGQHMEKTNFFYLLGALLFLLLASPIAQDLGLEESPITRAIVYSILLLVGVWSLRGGRLYLAGFVFVIAGIALSAIATSTDALVLYYASTLAIFGFLIIAISHALKQVVFGTEMNVNRLVGAICVFLLLGIIWSFAYSILELAVPGSFSGFEPGHDPRSDSSWLYFSFVTLTTLGYGDITPESATARTFAFMQAVVGQFYIAVLVAGLVSAYISDKQGS
jgi:voltage-gated potassium channel